MNRNSWFLVYFYVLHDRISIRPYAVVSDCVFFSCSIVDACKWDSRRARSGESYLGIKFEENHLSNPAKRIYTAIRSIFHSGSACGHSVTCNGATLHRIFSTCSYAVRWLIPFDNPNKTIAVSYRKLNFGIFGHRETWEHVSISIYWFKSPHPRAKNLFEIRVHTFTAASETIIISFLSQLTAPVFLYLASFLVPVGGRSQSHIPSKQPMINNGMIPTRYLGRWTHAQVNTNIRKLMLN